MQWAKDEPLSLPQLLQRHLDARGEQVALTTLSRVLKSAGLVNKRTRHSLKKNEIKPHLDEQAKR